jgi:hypothetical protein
MSYSGFDTPGIHAINGTVDTNCEVTESSESNNTKQSSVAVPVGSGIYDDTDSAWFYTGTWGIFTGSGPYNSTLHQSGTIGNYAEVTFTGNQIKLSYLKAGGRGVIDVYIDGTKVTSLNANSSTVVWQASWTSSILTLGTHTARFQQATSGTIDLDAIQIYGTPDTTAPAAISTLSASTGSGNGAVTLAWTAVGDDNTSGTATSYLVRYATSAIQTETNWNNASVVSSGIPTPKIAGQAESMTVSGLTAGQVYYFAVRAQDEQSNLGGLSNSPSATASTLTSVGAGIYDDTDSSWTYSGTWGVFTGSGPYNSTLHQSGTIGNYAEVTFTGNQVKLSYLKANGRGVIDVYIDGIKVTSLNANSATVVWQASWTSSVLTYGTHTVRFQQATSGTIDLDTVTIQ